MGVVYGVDFGTSNSSIVVGRREGRIVRIRNPVKSSHEIPSAVCLRRDGTMAVGSVATHMKLQRPSWYRDEFKRDIGSPVPHHFPAEDSGDSDQLPQDRSYPVYELVAEVLRLLRRQAEAEAPGDPDIVMLTVPAAWRDANRDLMRDAAAVAGFPPGGVRLITEPEAAAAYAAQEHLGLEERTLLVYDLGGGTFDCALVRGRGPLGFEFLGQPGGLENVGGILFDQQILSLIRDRYPERTQELLEGPPQDVPTLARRLQLRDTCENVKHVLSSEERYEGLLTELGPGVDFVLTREELAERLTPLLEETLDECERLLRGQGLDWSDVDGVVPVGGSVRLPMVGEMIARRAGRDGTSVQRVDDPELAVAHGAALHALRLVTDETPPIGSGGGRSAGPGTRGEPSDAASPRPSDAAPPEDAEVPPAAPAPAPPAGTDAPLNTAAAVVALTDTRSEDPPPATAQTFTARHSPRLRSIHFWNRVSAFLLIAAGVIVLAGFIGVGSRFTFSKTVTDDRLSIAVAALTCLSAVTLLRSAVVMNRMLLGVAGMVTSAVFLAGAAVAYYLLDGWSCALIVLLLLLPAFIAFAGGGAVGIPVRGSFVARLDVNSWGMSLHFDNGVSKELRWEDIDALFITGRGLDRKLYMRLPSPFDHRPFRLTGSRSKEKKTDDGYEYELFNSYHFPDGDEVLARIRAGSGGLLTDSW